MGRHLDAEFESDVVLKDGSTVLIRAATSRDRPALLQLMGGLSRESLYFRFFSVPRSPDREEARLLAADGSHTVALVADAGSRLAGVTSYVPNPRPPEEADVSFGGGRHARSGANRCRRGASVPARATICRRVELPVLRTAECGRGRRVTAAREDRRP
jgi:hypothetical protein